jgi:hypothetical protein
MSTVSLFCRLFVDRGEIREIAGNQRSLDMKKKFVFINLVFLITVSACSMSGSVREWTDRIFRSQSTQESQDDTEEPDTLRIEWQQDIDQLRNFYHSLSFPEHFLADNPTFQDGEFDVMSVFHILDHIWMEDGYRLAYVYQYDFMGGYPILYAHRTDEEAYLSYQAYLSDRGGCLEGDMNNPECNYLAHIEVDGSELGYLQLLLLDVMGNQFYLFWHAEYNDATFVATESAKEELIERISDPFISLTRQQRSQANRINITPIVSIDEETVDIRAVWFTKWGGFYESSYLIDRSSPYEVKIRSTNNLVEYDCGLMF